MKSQLIALAAAALLASVSGASLAQDANPPAGQPASGGSSAATEGVRTSCTPDVKKLCPSAADAASFRQCLVDNFANLSDGCKSAIAAYQSAGGN